jgi:ubiquinone/menaquinone biosynthesis C-methylase UbiE
MESRTISPEEEMARAAELPQADARTLVDTARLEIAVKEMYRAVAREEQDDLHFEIGRRVAERLGYAPEILDRVPAPALASFAGVGYHFDLAALRPGERVLDLGSGSGTDVFYAAVLVGERGSVVGVDFTDEQLQKARRVAAEHRFATVRFEAAWIEELPFEDASFDVVISNGVINLSPAKHKVFQEAARVLRPGGRLALSDIVSTWALKERTRRKVDLWAACIAGAIPRHTYLAEIESAGLTLRETHANDYRFVSERARGACATYGVGSFALLAT